jgi:hypothetical protein
MSCKNIIVFNCIFFSLNPRPYRASFFPLYYSDWGGWWGGIGKRACKRLIGKSGQPYLNVGDEKVVYEKVRNGSYNGGPRKGREMGWWRVVEIERGTKGHESRACVCFVRRGQQSWPICCCGQCLAVLISQYLHRVSCCPVIASCLL